MSGPDGSAGPLAFTWWGHASATVEIGGLRVALDPVLTDRLAHLRRYAPAPHPSAADADLVLISHLHADHCHLPSLRRFDRATPVVAPPGAARLVSSLGFPRVEAVEPGSVLSLTVGGAQARVEVLAATHDGRRHPFSRHDGPAVGYRAAVGDRSFWFPGDTGLREDMREVQPVDLALVPVGGWGPTLGPEHMDPRQAAEAVGRVGAAWATPVHWGTFWPLGLRRLDRRRHHHLFHTPGERFAAALARSGRVRSVVVDHGERVAL